MAVYPRTVTPRRALSGQGSDHMKFKPIIFALFLFMLAAPVVRAQGKGVDTQRQKVRDTGSNRSGGINGTKTDVGTRGSGLNFGNGKTRQAARLPTPYRLAAGRDTLVNAVHDALRN